MSNIEVLNEFQDLAPTIVRRRLVIECIHNQNFDEQKIKDYMVELSSVMKMTIVTMPVSNFVEGYGYSAYMSWKESGMHIYTWDRRDPIFISVDIYTCKKFEIEDAINYTKKHLRKYNKNMEE